MDLKAFLENFDTIAEAPGGIAKLKALILDLAVRGKLVLQDPEDEQAFTEAKSVIEIDIQDLPELPKSWILSTVDSACSHIVDCPHSTAKFVSEGFYCIDTNCISQRKILFEKARYVTDETFIQRTKRLLPEEGDILFSREGTIGVSAIVPKEVKLCLGQRMMMYRVHRFLDSFYFLYFLESPFFKKQLELKITGTAAKHVNIGDIRKMVVIIPPLAEQKRIVEKVDELMALCDRLAAAKQTRDDLRQKLRGSAISALMNAETDEALEKSWAIVRDNWHSLSQDPKDVDDLRRSILQLALRGKLVSQNSEDDPASDLLKEIEKERVKLIEQKKIRELKPLPATKQDELPFAIPGRWQWVRMQEIFTVITDGDHQAPPQTTSGVPFLVISNVREGFLNFASTRFVSEEFFLSVDGNRRPIRGDILYTVVGSYGIPVVVDTDQSFFVQRHIALLKPSKLLEVNYLKYVLKSDLVFAQATKFATGIAQKTVPLNGLRKMVIPLPPFAEQKRIVAKVDELIQMCDQLEASLRQSQQRAEALAASAISHLTI